MLASQAAWRLAGPFDGSLFAGDALFSSRALRAGITPWFEPRAVVVDQDEKLPSGFFGDRLRRGQEFGKMRAEFAHWTRPQLAMRSALAPVALAFTLGRMFHQCRRAGRLTDFAVTFPFQLAAQAAWCFGEALGYAELSQKAIPGDRPTL